MRYEFVEVNFDKMNKAITNIDRDIEQYRQTAKQLVETIQASQGWNGKDASAFQNTAVAVKERLDNMATLMESYSVYLKNCCEKYKSTQDFLYEMGKSIG